MKNNNISIDDINEVIESAGAGVWQITDEHELIFTAVASDRGLTVSDIYDDAQEALDEKPEVTDELIKLLNEANEMNEAE